MGIEYVGEQRKEQGEIYFAAGEVVIARTGSEAGVTALARIQGWQQAYYTFTEDATIPLKIQSTPLPQSTPAPIDPLESPLPGRYTIFRARPSVATPATMKRLERRERVVFALLDGRRTIQHVARLTHQGEGSIARILVKLFREGYIDYIQG
jgi:hypothetical protein